MSTDTLGDRIKKYERVYNFTLTPKSCLFVRVDGKAFHSFTKYSNKPFDDQIIKAMIHAMIMVAGEMQGFKAAYTQSDECTFMVTDFDSLDTQGWFDYKLSKILSISASAFTVYFNDKYQHIDNKFAQFDSRAFIVPQEDAPNVFIWRQRDWERNSLQMLARSHFSHRELNGKSNPIIHEMLYAQSVNWADLDGVYKNGTFLFGEVLEQKKLAYDELYVKLFGGD